jgi:hypothetical protein
MTFKINQILILVVALFLPVLCSAQNHISETDNEKKSQIQFESVTSVSQSSEQHQPTATINGQPAYKRNRGVGMPVVQELKGVASEKSNVSPVAKDSNGMVVTERSPNKK